MSSKMQSLPVTITLTRYREPDWLVDECLDSLAVQERVRGEVIFLDQNWRPDYAQAVEARSTDALKFSCLPCEERGICYARNRGIELSTNKFAIQVDPDVILPPLWSHTMLLSLTHEGAAIAGSKIVPKWRGRPPLLTRSRIVMDQYSMLDWGDDTKSVGRIVSAAFAMDIEQYREQLFFNENYGRREGVLFSGAETELCGRLRKIGAKVIYVGSAILEHQVLQGRLNWAWPLKRLYYAGASRRQSGGVPAPSRKPGPWDYLLLPIILPPYLAGYFFGPRPSSETE